MPQGHLTMPTDVMPSNTGMDTVTEPQFPPISPFTLIPSQDEWEGSLGLDTQSVMPSYPAADLQSFAGDIRLDGYGANRGGSPCSEQARYSPLDGNRFSII